MAAIVHDPDVVIVEQRRLAAYAATLAGGTALGFLLFASYANRLPVCDALSPVWLSDALLGGAEGSVGLFVGGQSGNLCSPARSNHPRGRWPCRWQRA